MDTGFDAIIEGLKGESSNKLRALSELKKQADIYGVDAEEVAIATQGLEVKLVDSNGEKLGAIAKDKNNWYFSADNRNGSANSADNALLALLNYHIENGGLVG